MKSVDSSCYESCITALAKANPFMAFETVQTGIHRYWGESLGWPAWVLEGTGYADPSELPKNIRLVDDLKLLANLLAHEGEEQLVSMLLNWPHYPGEAIVLAAPDLKSALMLIAEATSQKNSHIAVSYTEADDQGVILVQLSPLLGPFLPIHEQVMLTVLFLLVRTFVGVGINGASELSRIEIGAARSQDLLQRLLPCRVSSAKNHPYLAIPADLLARPGLAHDPDTWRLITQSHAPVAAVAATPGLSGRQAIEAAILKSLRSDTRVPQLAELARVSMISERTLSRQLARSGLSYLEIVDTARMHIATELLLEQNQSVVKVSERLGYSDVSAFVRSFRRRYGASPARWRKIQRGTLNSHDQGRD